MKIAHIISDEKFPDSAFELFEEVSPGCNFFILPDTKSELKHIRKANPIRVGSYSFLDKNFISWINSFDAVLIHGMKKFSIELISRCSKSLKVYWIGMGFDYYDIIYSSKLDSYKESTKNLMLTEENKTWIKKVRVEKVINKIKNKFLYKNSNKKRSVLRRVDYFCPVLESEFYKLKEKVEGWEPKYIDWNYGNSANLVDGYYGTDFSLGNDVLLGNSATPTNNHIDALDFLKKYISFLPKDSKIVAPLNYGDENYRTQVIQYGKQLFGNRFHPLITMLTPLEYNNVTRSCGIVLMNHIRQQAGNNIAQSLFMGARVILDRENPFYEYYKEHNVFINAIDEVETAPNLLSEYLSTEQIKRNQDVLRSLRGNQTAIAKTRELVKSISPRL